MFRFSSPPRLPGVEARGCAYFRRQGRDHTLGTPTALVHETYLRLVEQGNVRWQNRAQFFGIAAQLMRRILVDHARKHNAAKRGGSLWRVGGSADVTELRGLLHRTGGRSVSIEEMNAAIRRQHSRRK